MDSFSICLVKASRWAPFIDRVWSSNSSPLKPHEDGPAYHPVVATISLGSHAIFHYYQYQDNLESGYTIDRTPVLSLLLERRSVVITTSSLYTDHLHGIEERDEDDLEFDQGGSLRVANTSASIANQNMVTGGLLRLIRDGGGRLKRGIRYSLTCRDVGRVASSKAFGR